MHWEETTKPFAEMRIMKRTLKMSFTRTHAKPMAVALMCRLPPCALRQTHNSSL
jgi:hypothetical protein